MYRYDCWTIEKAEHQRIDGFELWCGRDSWGSLGPQGDTTHQYYRKSSLNIIKKDWCWSSNSVAIWCKELTHGKRFWCWARLRARGEGDNREWDGWTALLTQWTWVLSKFLELVMDREAWRAAVHGVRKSWTRVSDWSELNWIFKISESYICPHLLKVLSY